MIEIAGNDKHILIGGEQQPVIVAGPCSVESP